MNPRGWLGVYRHRSCKGGITRGFESRAASSLLIGVGRIIVEKAPNYANHNGAPSLKHMCTVPVVDEGEEARTLISS